MAGQTFAAIPIRSNGQDVDANWWNLLRLAGINIESLVSETDFTLVNNQSIAADVTGLLFDHTIYKSIAIDYDVRRVTSTTESVGRGRLTLVWSDLNSAWYDPVDSEFNGAADHGITWTITAGGQLRYQTSNFGGTPVLSRLKYRISTFNA